jgi:ABC-2 type transport system ATP-binding protein
MSAPPAILAERVSKAFQRVPVLDGVGLEVAAGERIALVGPNGAGKTTLIRCLLGQYRCAGRVVVGGLAPRDHRGEVLRRIGFVPQLPPPLRMPVAQLLGFASDLCGADVAAIERDAGELGLDLDGLRRRPFAKLSGGQKQKLLIAIALRPDASLLIMDEPAANLDPEARRRLFELLAARADGATMVISSHRIDEVAGLVQRVVELDRGRIALDERIADDGGLDATLHCRVELARREEVACRAFEAWGLGAVPSEGEAIAFEGDVAGPDRLRFFGMLARYAGLVSAVSLEAARPPEDRA